jgi:cobalamin biosynthesis protein CbiG
MTNSMPTGPLYAVALTRDGAGLVARLAKAFPGTVALAPARFAGEVAGVEGFRAPVKEVIAGHWAGAGGFLLVMAAGIAVRAVAPLLVDKAVDPAVVVLDPMGRFAVPLLSGHLGGANTLAREVGRRLGAEPVITTATDAAGVPAIEVWARQMGLSCGERAGVVRVNAAWANGEPVGLYVDPAVGALQPGSELEPHLVWHGSDAAEALAFSGTLVVVSHRREAIAGAVLNLHPRCLYLGVGCRKDADPEAVAEGVLSALAAAGLARTAVASVASVDLKQDELALRQLAALFEVPFRVFPPAALSRMEVPTPSDRVAQAVGTSSVSEAAALLASDGGRLLSPKQKGPLWTLAVAIGDLEHWRPSPVTRHPSPVTEA